MLQALGGYLAVGGVKHEVPKRCPIVPYENPCRTIRGPVRSHTVHVWDGFAEVDLNDPHGGPWDAADSGWCRRRRLLIGVN